MNRVKPSFTNIFPVFFGGGGLFGILLGCLVSFTVFAGFFLGYTGFLPSFNVPTAGISGAFKAGDQQLNCQLETVLRGHENWVYGLHWEPTHGRQNQVNFT